MKNPSSSANFRGRAAVGMSGGADSSAAAALLVEEGWEVIGLTVHMWKEGSRCCSLEDAERARKVCAALGIRHYVLNAQELFEQEVVDPFVAAYAAGRTPSPCIVCNEKIKFGFLLRRAVQLGCDILATGHYARIEQDAEGRFHLLRAADRRKDQSYFLHRLGQAQLARIRFPLEGFEKEEVLALLRGKGLPIAPRGESQDLCFVEEGRLPEFVERRRPDVARPGEIRADGKTVGRHRGLHRFTVGQRTGLGVALGERMYVSRLDPEGNVIELAPREGVMRRRCRVEEIHWIAGEPPGDRFRCEVQPRYRARPAAAEIRLLSADGRAAEILFDEPQFAPAPGQAAVFYRGDEVLGGGWIRSAAD